MKIFWQLADPDNSKSFSSGYGEDALRHALTKLIARQASEAPAGLTPNGNISIYWIRSVKAAV